MELSDEEGGGGGGGGGGGEGGNTLELPPELDRGETAIFNSDPGRTLASFQKELEEGGRIDLRRKVDYTADEFEVIK